MLMHRGQSPQQLIKSLLLYAGAYLHFSKGEDIIRVACFSNKKNNDVSQGTNHSAYALPGKKS